MSQIPTNNDIPGNSHKAQQEAAANKKPEVVPFDGEVAGAKRKKGSFWAWCRKMFLSDRKPSEIMMDVLENQIVPGIKDNVRNSVVSSIDMFVYQSAKPASQTTSNNNISYNNIFRASTSPQTKSQTTQPATNDVDLNKGFVNPCFKFKQSRRGPDGKVEKGAEDFLQMMKDYDYPTLSVHTMYMMMHRHIDFTWDAYGWTREEIAGWDPHRIIVHINNTDTPWMIDLPQAHVIS